MTIRIKIWHSSTSPERNSRWIESIGSCFGYGALHGSRSRSALGHPKRIHPDRVTKAHSVKERVSVGFSSKRDLQNSAETESKVDEHRGKSESPREEPQSESDVKSVSRLASHQRTSSGSSLRSFGVALRGSHWASGIRAEKVIDRTATAKAPKSGWRGADKKGPFDRVTSANPPEFR
jgi:hypothetical protein